jgi:hypothetical protein
MRKEMIPELKPSFAVIPKENNNILCSAFSPTNANYAGLFKLLGTVLCLNELY